MTEREIIVAVEHYVKDYLKNAEPGHDWQHIERVRKTALYILDNEKTGDRFIIELAALMHDIGDRKIDSQADAGLIIGRQLGEMDIDPGIIERVISIVENISFRDSYMEAITDNAELSIVQDADRLDAIGAIGVARAFSYGAIKGNAMHLPGSKPSTFSSSEEYLSGSTTTVNHFYEKLLLLRDMMNTDTGRRLAEERHLYMLSFLEQFMKEWDLS